ncbi:Fructose-bisphosphate aldolase class II (EC [uncultured Gammaproteobacteria bacterium]|nr:Fructose-bisphosphate aldolase class II (EC [uncultured Gammaproteobacteria bacterium]
MKKRLIFVKATNVDALAIAIGTSHGAYKFTAEPTGDVLVLTVLKKSTHASPTTFSYARFVFSATRLVRNHQQSCGDMGQTYGVPVNEIVERH